MHLLLFALLLSLLVSPREAFAAKASPKQSSSSSSSSPKDTHQEERWKRYRARGGTWSRAHWDVVYRLNQDRALKANAVANDYQRQLGWGKREYSFYVGDILFRRLDIGDPERQRGVEVKSGYQTLTVDNRSEIERDALLRKNRWDIRWHFTGTYSAQLGRALADAKIPFDGGKPRKDSK